MQMSASDTFISASLCANRSISGKRDNSFATLYTDIISAQFKCLCVFRIELLSIWGIQLMFYVISDYSE